VIGLVDLTQDTLSEFAGIGYGFVNGLAVDSQDGIFFCTTTEDDASLEFYDLSTQSGFSVVLPGSGEQHLQWTSVMISIHKVFLAAQWDSR
jgi:hypothetical protein